MTKTKMYFSWGRGELANGRYSEGYGTGLWYGARNTFFFFFFLLFAVKQHKFVEVQESWKEGGFLGEEFLPLLFHGP